METNRDEILRQMRDLERELEQIDKDKVKFTIDAGLIDRLGRELVGKQETAVSELVKNAYDADATEVVLSFIDSDGAGGTLTIEDNGHGMDMASLRNGFMRISSTDKVHSPVSPRFKRKRAGRKGIGRFATHRLGQRLVITTQDSYSETALQLVINWADYAIDSDIQTIANKVSEVPKTKPQGTTLTIENLREGWTLAEIRRVFRYVADLLQPAYLSDRLKKSEVVFASQEDESFSVKCQKVSGGIVEIVSDIDKTFFEKSLAFFEGFVDQSGEGYCSIESRSLGLKPLDNLMVIEPERYSGGRFKFLGKANVHFKAYYFIYNRIDYYEGEGFGITTSELKQANEFGNIAGGIRLYRNGFRVPPYGVIGDDWLDIDMRYTSSGGRDVIPFANKNVFGFVEILDETGQMFEETSSREGLLNNDSFEDLKDFLKSAFQSCRRRLESTVEFRKKREQRQKRIDDDKTQKERLRQLRLFIEETTASGDGSKNEKTAESSFNVKELKETVDEIERTLEEQLDEIAMLRVLAGMGLFIGEFVHEFRHYSPAFDGDLNALAQLALDERMREIAGALRENFDTFKLYASYFDETVQENTSRARRNISIKEVVQKFIRNINRSEKRRAIDIEEQFVGNDLLTLPMHPSEWVSIFLNLYSNSLKAIARARVEGKIRIAAREEGAIVAVEFSDNGNGILDEDRERIFRPFWTTSMPASRRTPQEGEFVGSGLGLKIVSDIVQSYGGEISVASPPPGFKTCIRIELPKATDEQIEAYYG